MKLPDEIINAIRTDAEKKFPTTYHDGVIERDDLLFPLKREVYISGREEQLEKDLEFIEWAFGDDNPFIKSKGKWIQACGNSTSWTLEQLILEYIKTREGI